MLDTTFEGEDYRYAMHDSEDNLWFGVENVNIQNRYEIATDLDIEFEIIKNCKLEILTDISDIGTPIFIDTPIEEEFVEKR